MSDELRNRVAETIWQNTLCHREGAQRIAQIIIDDLGLVLTSAHREHKAGSALELGETEEQYHERVRPKTIYRVAGRWEENE